MLEDVNEGISLLGLIGRRPVSDVLDSMSFKEFCGVLSEAAQQFSQLARGSLIDPEFVDRARGLLRIGVVLLQGGPK